MKLKDLKAAAVQNLSSAHTTVQTYVAALESKVSKIIGVGLLSLIFRFKK